MVHSEILVALGVCVAVTGFIYILHSKRKRQPSTPKPEKRQDENEAKTDNKGKNDEKKPEPFKVEDWATEDFDVVAVVDNTPVVKPTDANVDVKKPDVKPVDTIVKPKEEPKQPIVEPAKPKEEAKQPTVEPAKPKEEPKQPIVEPAKPKEEAKQPEPIKPKDEKEQPKPKEQPPQSTNEVIIETLKPKEVPKQDENKNKENNSVLDSILPKPKDEQQKQEQPAQIPEKSADDLLANLAGIIKPSISLDNNNNSNSNSFVVIDSIIPSVKPEKNETPQPVVQPQQPQVKQPEEQPQQQAGDLIANIVGILKPAVGLEKNEKNKNDAISSVPLTPLIPAIQNDKIDDSDVVIVNKPEPENKPEEPKKKEQAEQPKPNDAQAKAIDDSNEPKDTGFGKINIGLFYDAARSKLSLSIYSAERLINVDKTGLSDPYARAILEPDASKSTKRKTKIIKNSLNPTWNETFEWTMTRAETESKTLEISIKDDKSIFEKQETVFLGRVSINLKTAPIYTQLLKRSYYLQPESRIAGILISNQN